MVIQSCPVETANVHPRNILGSRSSFNREQLSPFGSLNSALDRLANASYQMPAGLSVATLCMKGISLATNVSSAGKPTTSASHLITR